MFQKLFLVLFAAVLFQTGCGSDDKNNPTMDTGLPDVGVNNAQDVAPDVSDEMDLNALLELGPEKVGHQKLTISYAAPGIAAPREIPVEVWYPAAESADEPTVNYRLGGIVQIPSETAMIAAETKSGSYPVLVYSHGSGGEGMLAYPYAEHFASHGWVVVAPDHIGNTSNDAIQGTIMNVAQIALYRVTDITAVIDAMESGPTAVAGIADTENVMLFGHSFGAYTTLAAGGSDVDIDGFIANCAVFGQASCDFVALPDVDAAFRNGFGDPRIDAIAPQAPAINQVMADDGLASISVPALLMSGRRDQTTTHALEATPAWNQLDGEDDRWVDFRQAGHLSFISVCYDVPEQVLSQFYTNYLVEGCGDDFLSAEDVVTFSNAYLFAFAHLHVLGDDSWADVLDGIPQFEESILLSIR